MGEYSTVKTVGLCIVVFMVLFIGGILGQEATKPMDADYEITYEVGGGFFGSVQTKTLLCKDYKMTDGRVVVGGYWESASFFGGWSYLPSEKVLYKVVEISER